MDWYEQDLTGTSIVHKAGRYNCPNCAAPIDSEKCPYCGTVFVDFAAIDADDPFYMKVKYQGEVFIIKAKLTSMSMQSDTIDYVTLDNRYFSKRGPTELSMDFVVL